MTIPERVLAGDFAGWLADAIDQRQLSLRMVAHRTGLHPSTLVRLRRYHRTPSLETAILLFAFFERSALAALDDDEQLSA